MPISTGNYTDNITSDEERLLGDYQRLQERYSTGDNFAEQNRIQDEGDFAAAGMSIGHGLQEGVNSMLNLPSDLLGLKKVADIDWVTPREGFLNESISAVSQFAAGLPAGGPIGRSAVSLVQKAAKTTKATTKGKVARKSKKEILKESAKKGLVTGGGADFIAFSGDESLVMHLLNAHPELRDAYTEITSKDGWQNKDIDDLVSETLSLKTFSAERMAKNWAGRGLNVAEGAFIGAMVNVLWRAARLKFNNDEMTKKVVEGKDKAIQRGVTATEQRHGKVLTDDLTEKEQQELAAFRHNLMSNQDDAIPQVEKKRIQKEEAELSAAQADLADKANTLKERSHHSALDEEDALAPSVWDEADERAVAKIGIDDVIGDDMYLTKGFVRHDASYKPILNFVNEDPAYKDIAIASRVEGENKVFIDVNQTKLQEIWNAEGPSVNAPNLKRSYVRDAFNDYNDFEAFAIAREKAKVRFPQLRKGVETKAGYQNRLDRAAANELKRKGLGNFWKYEFDTAKGMEHFKLDDDTIRASIFKDPEKAKQLTESLLNARKGEGVDLNKAFLDALDIINIDATMTDGGQKYLTARLIKYFTDTLGKGFTGKTTDPLGDQFAKAIGWHGDSNRMGAADWLQDDLLNQFDDIATSTGLTPQGVAERMRKGYGDFKHLWKETTVDDALRQDVAVNKELYIRTWAYRLDQAVTMKQVEAAAETITQLKGTPSVHQLAEFATLLERIQSKLTAFRSLRTAQGRSLAANKKFQFIQTEGKGLGGNEQVLEEIMNRAGGNKGLTDLAAKIDAIMSANKGKHGTAAAAGLINKSISGIDVHNEYWINAILSGTRTLVVNTVSTALNVVHKPIEGMLGALGGNKEGQAFMRSQLMYSANMMYETMKVLGSLGLNKAQRFVRFQSDDAYMAKRGKNFEAQNHASGVMAAARKSFRHGKSTIDSRSELFDVQPAAAITGDTLNQMLGGDVSEWAKTTIDQVGRIIRLPSRFMIATDELFKQIQFRSASMAKLYNEALDVIPKDLQSEDNISKYVSERFQGLIRSTGARFTPDIIRDEAYKNYTAAVLKAEQEGTALPDEFKNKEQYILDYVDENYTKRTDKETLSEFAMDWAEDTTYTRGLDVDLKRIQNDPNRPALQGESSFTKTVQDAIQKHSWLRAIMPFVRTPMNLVLHPLQRLPILHNQALNAESGWLKKLHKRYQADMLSDDPVRVAEAQGRMRMGKIMYPSIMLLASSGVVTGQGPTDPVKRRQLMATGWRPYSIKWDFNGKTQYSSFARLDPFATMLGLAADTAEFVMEAGRAGDMDENWAETLAVAGMYSLSNNLANKTYAAQLSNFLAVVNEPVQNRNLGSLLEKQFASYVPKFGSQFTAVTDNHYYRKAYGLMDTMKNQIPFLASSIEPLRNILGDPMEYMGADMMSRITSMVNPFISSAYKNDSVLDALASLNYGFQAPEPRLLGKTFLDMRKYKNEDGRTAYDWFQERIGTILMGGKTLRERLLDYFKSQRFVEQNAFEDRFGFESIESDPRVTKVKSLIAKYRNKAKHEMLAAFPELKANQINYKKNYNQIQRLTFT